MEQRKLNETRTGITRKFTCGAEVYLTVNTFPDGEPAEIFVRVAKQGSTLSGLMQAWAITVSAALQRDISWDELREKYLGMLFEPKTHEYKSLVDAVAQNVDQIIQELRVQHIDIVGDLTQQTFDFSDDE